VSLTHFLNGKNLCFSTFLKTACIRSWTVVSRTRVYHAQWKRCCDETNWTFRVPNNWRACASVEQFLSRVLWLEWTEPNWNRRCYQRLVLARRSSKPYRRFRRLCSEQLDGCDTHRGWWVGRASGTGREYGWARTRRSCVPSKHHRSRWRWALLDCSLRYYFSVVLKHIAFNTGFLETCVLLGFIRSVRFYSVWS
jgi:hypothetical protein